MSSADILRQILSKQEAIDAKLHILEMKLDYIFGYLKQKEGELIPICSPSDTCESKGGCKL